MRPRLFLEGKFYVDLKPGTPATGELPDGGIIPVTETGRPVQLDQVLSTFPLTTRLNFQRTLARLGSAPRQEGGASARPVRQALNDTLRTSPQSLRDSTLVAQALVGPPRNSLAAAIRGFGRAGRSVTEDGDDTTALVTDFNATMEALASQSSSLEQTCRSGPTAANARQSAASGMQRCRRRAGSRST